MNSYIYFIGTADGALVKIGKANSPLKRLASLRGQSPIPLELLAFAPGGYEDETRVLRFFKDHRAHGEWFRTNPALSSLISQVRHHAELPRCVGGTGPKYSAAVLLRMVPKEHAA